MRHTVYSEILQQRAAGQAADQRASVAQGVGSRIGLISQAHHQVPDDEQHQRAEKGSSRTQCDSRGGAARRLRRQARGPAVSTARRKRVWRSWRQPL